MDEVTLFLIIVKKAGQFTIISNRDIFMFIWKTCIQVICGLPNTSSTGKYFKMSSTAIIHFYVQRVISTEAADNSKNICAKKG